MAGCKPKKFAAGGAVKAPAKGLGPVVLEPPRRPPQRSDVAAPPMNPKAPIAGPVKGVTQTSLSPRRSDVAAPPMGPKAVPVRSDVAAPPMGPKAGSVTGVTQTSLPTRGPSANLGTAAGPGGGKPIPQNIAASYAAQGQGLGSLNSPTQASMLGSMGAGTLGSMGRAFKKGGMVNAKKKSKASGSKSSSVKPRGAGGRGVKSCKVC
jgi:hypothetical protein